MVFDSWTVYSCWTELFELELFICIKMDLALNNKGWYAIKPKKPNENFSY